MVHRADDELRAIDLVQRTTGLLGPLRQLLHRQVVVVGRHAVVEYNAISDLTGQLHHLGAGRADVNGHVPWLSPTVHDVQLDAVHVMELAVKGDVLQRQQATYQLDCLAHRFKGFAPDNAHVLCQWIPPRPDATDDPTGGQIVESDKGRRQQADVARPVVDDARADFDALGHRGKGCHRHNGVAHEAAFRLPNGLKAALFSILSVLDPIPNWMSVLQIESNSLHDNGLLFLFVHLNRTWSKLCRAKSTRHSVLLGELTGFPL